MLSFATEFPIASTHEVEEFFAVLKSWILDSPHTSFSKEDFKDFGKHANFKIRNKDQIISLDHHISDDEVVASINNIVIEGNVGWSTTVVYSRRALDIWVGVRTTRESNIPAVRLPIAKKPFIVRALLSKFGGGLDGTVEVKPGAHILNDDDVDFAAQTLLGQAECRLPVVYVSANFSGKHGVDYSALANDLAGMAHVLVEPHRNFSRNLQIESFSQNVYGGSVGIYWPNASGRRSFFNYQDYPNKSDLKRCVIDEIKSALLNKRPLYRCTAAAVQEIISKKKLGTIYVLDPIERRG